MAYCGEAIIVKGDSTIKKAVTLRCRAWTCPDCASTRRKGLIAEAHRGSPNTFLTLTSRRDVARDPYTAALDLAWAWRTVRKRAIREAARDPKKDRLPFGAAPPDGWQVKEGESVRNLVDLIGGTLPFIAVFEKTQLGWPHLHILCRSTWIEQRWLSAQMLDLIASPVVHIRRTTKREQRNAYVAKYAGCDSHRFGSTKRYWSSRDYAVAKREQSRMSDGIPGGWERDKMTLEAWVRMWRCFSWSIDRPDVNCAIARGPPQ